MLKLPEAEREKFRTLVEGEAARYVLSVHEYLRKVWYHEAAARLGEYVALSLVDQLLELIQEHTKEGVAD